MKKLSFIAIAISLIVVIGCKKEDIKKVETPLSSIVKTNIYASLPNFQFFSFATGDTVSISDSATTKWDIAFKSTAIIVNNNINGPGQAGIIIKNALFSEITDADAGGYVADSIGKNAIPTGSGNGWYTYDFVNNIVSPTPGKVFVVRTATGNYAKFEIISYYKDAPNPPSSASTSRYYTIRYIYQPNGTTKLE